MSHSKMRTEQQSARSRKRLTNKRLEKPMPRWERHTDIFLENKPTFWGSVDTWYFFNFLLSVAIKAKWNS